MRDGVDDFQIGHFPAQQGKSNCTYPERVNVKILQTHSQLRSKAAQNYSPTIYRSLYQH